MIPLLVMSIGDSLPDDVVTLLSLFRGEAGKRLLVLSFAGDHFPEARAQLVGVLRVCRRAL
jgi:hypothetical protein